MDAYSVGLLNIARAFAKALTCTVRFYGAHLYDYYEQSIVEKASINVPGRGLEDTDVNALLVEARTCLLQFVSPVWQQHSPHLVAGMEDAFRELEACKLSRVRLKHTVIAFRLHPPPLQGSTPLIYCFCDLQRTGCIQDRGRAPHRRSETAPPVPPAKHSPFGLSSQPPARTPSKAPPSHLTLRLSPRGTATAPSPTITITEPAMPPPTKSFKSMAVLRALLPSVQRRCPAMMEEPIEDKDRIAYSDRQIKKCAKVLSDSPSSSEIRKHEDDKGKVQGKGEPKAVVHWMHHLVDLESIPRLLCYFQYAYFLISPFVVFAIELRMLSAVHYCTAYHQTEAMPHARYMDMVTVMDVGTLMVVQGRGVVVFRAHICRIVINHGDEAGCM
ncbi:hypothetical protein V8E53_011702 [Lactarius tabidus]